MDVMAHLHVFPIKKVYFAVPEWIKTYWSYPLVQKAKHELTYKVNRDSPEEKILDFYERMDTLTKVITDCNVQF